jgi:hypothetical protein
MINGEQPLEVLTHFLLVKLFLHFLNPKILSYFLEQYLQKHSSSCCCGFGLQDYDLEDSPINSKPEQQVPKEFGKISDLVDLELEDGVVMVDE